MSAVKDVTILTTTTSILTAADWKNYSGPLYLKNESSEIEYITISGADVYELDPGEPIQVLPGQIVTGTSIGGAALLQIIAGIVPSDESASKGGGSVAAAGSIAAGDGRNKWSTAQGDFTAVYAGPDTLTLGTFPTAMGTPNDGDFSMVVVTDSTGLQKAYFPTLNAMTLTGQVLEVVGAAFVTGVSADLDYDVIAWGPPRGHDLDANADQVWNVRPEYLHADKDQLIGASLGNGTEYEYFDVEYFKTWGVQITDVAGGAGDNTYTLELSKVNDGTAEASVGYIDRTDELLGQASFTTADLVADPDKAAWDLALPVNTKFIRIKQVRANDGGGTDGGYTYDAMWS